MRRLRNSETSGLGEDNRGGGLEGMSYAGMHTICGVG